MSAYSAVLFAHSALRWVVLLLLVAVAARTALAWSRRREWTGADRSWSVALVVAMDLQFLIGVALYTFLSPLTRAFFSDPGGGMKDPVTRFFGLEHAFAMALALAAVHVGRAVSRQAATPARRHARLCLTTLIALLLVLAGIPWPALSYGRPLLRAAAGSVLLYQWML
jgi:hypothetical protein